MASVMSNGGNFTHFKPPQKREIFPVYLSIFIESEGVTSFRNGEYSRFSGRSAKLHSRWRLSCTSLSNPTIAGEFRLARLVGFGMEDKHLVTN
jgi:hypothetical protein